MYPFRIHISYRAVETKEVYCTVMYERKCGGNEKEIICLVDNEDLAGVIWTQGFKVDLPIIVDTSQQSFSSWTFSQIKTLFGLTADSYIYLPRFNGELTNTTDYKKILGHILEDIAIVTSANEAIRCEFISSVLHGVASCYDGEVKVCPEYELSGSHGKGPVDWVIKIGDTIIVVTEAKSKDINQGLVTTGKYNDSDNGNVEVLLSSRIPFTFPINESVFDKSLMLEKLKNLFRQIKWVFDCQIELQESLKRSKNGR
ncbi:hypothetical protein C1646_772826 [Rhizophagus diaphanus]|nr:hypothetical protein C1646_772826 [Rhizophagus diaphanus] [Rhizophagus sp. MUCL 43196]